MPLSEQEQRALDELEAQLSAEDPKFASSFLADPHRRRARMRIVVGGLVMLVGLAIVLLAVSTQQIWISVGGFAAMVFGAAYAFSTTAASANTRREAPDLHLVGGGFSGSGASHGLGSAAARSGRPGRRSPRSGGQNDFMQRLEERWERRRHENQGW